MKNKLLELTPRWFHGIHPALTYLDRILALQEATGSPMRNIQIQNNLIAFLLEVIRCAQENRPTSQSIRMDQLLAYMDRNVESPLGLTELAGQAGLSISRLKVWFKQETGLPPGEYTLRWKIKKAQQLLTDPTLSIIRIAFDLGFSSSQYFATVFKRYTGKTPRAYRAESNPSSAL